MTKFKIKICMREILTSYCFCPDLYRLKRYKQVEKTCKIKDERVQYIFYALIEKIPTISPEAGDYVFCYTSQLQSADHANQYANHIRTLELFIFSTLAGTQVSPRFQGTWPMSRDMFSSNWWTYLNLEIWNLFEFSFLVSQFCWLCHRQIFIL